MFKVGDKVTPVSLGGASYQDAKLNIENNIAIVSPSFQSYLFEVFLQILALGGLVFMISGAWGDDSSDAKTFILVVTIMCLSFSGIVRLIFFKIRKKHNFDKSSDVYYPGKRIRTKSVIKLSEIEKLYLISKEIYSSNKSYTSFELSISTFDGCRVLIMNHGDWHKINRDAELLSIYLNVPCENLKNGSIYEQAKV